MSEIGTTTVGTVARKGSPGKRTLNLRIKSWDVVNACQVLARPCMLPGRRHGCSSQDLPSFFIALRRSRVKIVSPSARRRPSPGPPVEGGDFGGRDRCGSRVSLVSFFCREGTAGFAMAVSSLSVVLDAIEMRNFRPALSRWRKTPSRYFLVSVTVKWI